MTCKTNYYGDHFLKRLNLLKEKDFYYLTRVMLILKFDFRTCLILPIMKAKEVKELDPLLDKINDPGLKDDFKNKLNELTESPLKTDKWIYRSIVWALGIVIILCIVFTFSIVLKNTGGNTEIKIPDIFLAVASAGIGALAGLLAPSPKGE